MALRVLGVSQNMRTFVRGVDMIKVGVKNSRLITLNRI